MVVSLRGWLTLPGCPGCSGSFSSPGLPKHCEEGKQKYGWTESGEYFIDVDGMDGDDEGNLDPFLVHCNMDDYPNTAVTELPHDK